MTLQKIGCWKVIENIGDEHVQDIGRYAVTEHYKKTGQDLKFKRVINGLKQLVAGTNYMLIVEAETKEKINWTYKTIVWEKLSREMELTSSNTKWIVDISPSFLLHTTCMPMYVVAVLCVLSINK